MKPETLKKIFEKYISRNNLMGYPGIEWPEQTGIAVVIPVYLEEDYLDACLNSIISAEKINTPVSVLLVVNSSERDTTEIVARQEKMFEYLEEQSQKLSEPGLKFFVLKKFGIRWKHAGVGAARKTGMDMAVWGFRNSGRYEGPIVSLDADVIIAPDYFKEIEKYFRNEKNSGCTIYFEHDISTGTDAERAEAITQYELYLRYYKNALRYAGAPFAYHTVGSCFALRAGSYVRAGGMPRKQAGEDFYLIQKAAQMGGWGELNSTCVYPSSRPSDRVPFGTGPVVKDLMSGDPVYKTYTPDAFYALKELFDKRADLYRITDSEYDTLLKAQDKPLRSFLIQDDFIRELEHLNKNCSSVNVFEKRFFEVFNAFKVVKYLNFVHNGYYEKLPVTNAAVMLLKDLNMELPEKTDAVSLLMSYRKIDNKTG